MPRKPIVYCDTSVFGGYFEPGFEAGSRAFLELVHDGEVQLVVSALVLAELRGAPVRIQQAYDRVASRAHTVKIGPESDALQRAYLAAGVVGPASSSDAMHVALAAIAKCHAIVSWNFKHIVHFQKIPLYNQISVRHGYGALNICTPEEVVRHARGEI